MLYVGFIHGIGNFQPTDEDKKNLLRDLQEMFSASLGRPIDEVVPFFLYYDDIIEAQPESKAAKLLANLASIKYTGTSQLGSLLVDYGSDILEYYLNGKLRDKIQEQVLGQLSKITGGHASEHDVVLIGHSLGSLVLARARKNLAVQSMFIGSPLYSVIPMIRWATRNMALRGLDLKSSVGLQYNVWSKLDPLSGPDKDQAECADLRVKGVIHRDVKSYVQKALQSGCFQSLRARW